jgi:hypothetical protein
MVVVQRESELLEVVLALRATGGLPRLLYSRQEQRNQNGYNRNHDQQLDQRESAPAPHRSMHGSIRFDERTSPVHLGHSTITL